MQLHETVYMVFIIVYVQSVCLMFMLLAEPLPEKLRCMVHVFLSKWRPHTFMHIQLENQQLQLSTELQLWIRFIITELTEL